MRNVVSRRKAIAAFAICVAIGVPSKWYEGVGEQLVQGQWWDLFGAAAVYFLARALFPFPPAVRVAGVVWVVLMVNEFLQLAEGALFERLRGNPVGAVVLGSSFSWLDVLVITVALVLVVPLDRVVTRTR